MREEDRGYIKALALVKQKAIKAKKLVQKVTEEMVDDQIDRESILKDLTL